MSEKELIKNLNNLKKIKPDNEWKNNYREILFSQISLGLNAADNGENKNKIQDIKFGWRMLIGDLLPGRINLNFAKPVWVIILTLSILSGGGIASIYASTNSKPGDSLYIAKIISEKAQLVITFGEKEKAKLSIEFAANRAKEITQVLEEKGQDNGEKKEKVEMLAKDFKREINEVKNRLSKINKETAQNTNANNKKEETEDTTVFGANLSKENQGLEIAEPETQGENKAPADLNVNVETDKTATTTISDGAVDKNKNSESASSALEEAEELFNKENYSETINKLSEVNKIIDESGKSEDEKGQVQGASEGTATTTN